MQLIKGFLFAVLGLATLVTIISLFMPSTVVTVRAEVMQANKVEILNAVTDLKEWRNWHPLFREQPGVLISDPSAGAGAWMQWATNNKTNKLQIIKATTESIEFTLSRPGENTVQNFITVLPVSDRIGLQVEWRAVTKLKWYPWEKFAGMFLDKIAGESYQQSLQSLKNYVEQKSSTGKADLSHRYCGEAG
jgi:hypothetical protein